MFGCSSAFPGQPSPVVFSPGEKDPTWLLCSKWSSSAPGPLQILQTQVSGQVLQQDSDLGTEPSPAEQRVHAPRHPKGLQDPAATSSISTTIQAGKERIRVLGLHCFGKEDYGAVSLPSVEEEIAGFRRAPQGRNKRPVKSCCLKLQSVPLGGRNESGTAISQHPGMNPSLSSCSL